MLRRHLKRHFFGHVLCVLGSVMLVASAEINFDELLERTSYAQMLKELICMTDAIGLLKHHMDQDERRFIEDSILGKIVRVTRLLSDVRVHHVSSEDVDYLHYWLELAQQEDLPHELQDEIFMLDQKVMEYFSLKS